MPGSPIGFSVRLTNSDNVPATALSFSDVLPAGFGIDWSLDAATSDAGWSVVGRPPNQTLIYSPTSIAGNSIRRAHVISATTRQSCGVHVNTASFTHTLDSGSASAAVSFVRPVFLERFDGVATPALPAGWSVSQGINTGGFPGWASSSSGSPVPVAVSAPNSAFSVDPDNIFDNRLDSPPFAFAERATLTFRHRAVLEVGWDGGVLEISIDGGEFRDILTAGGSFVTGRYNDTLDTRSSNPIGGGRSAWTGSIGGTTTYITVIVNLPVSAVGKSVVLRWRLGSDEAVADQGWRIDNISVVETVTCPRYAFAGFLPPIRSTTVNDVTAGASVPVKFSLGGDQGLNILGATSPRSQPVHCTTLAPLGPASATSTPGESQLTFDAASGIYTYVWNTERSWKGTCRALSVELLDQTVHSATFRFD